MIQFILHQSVTIEETRHYEFKEIKGSNPVDTIKNTVDEYVVAFLNSEGGSIYWGIRDADRVVLGVPLDSSQRDKLRRLVSEKLSQILPAVAPTAYRIEFHPVYEESGSSAQDRFVVEVIAPQVSASNLYFTGSNEAWVKTDGGKKKLKGPELQDEIIRRRQVHIVKSVSSGSAMKEQRLHELLAAYEVQLENKISHIKIFGGDTSYPLEKVFVELTINDEYDPRAGDSQHLGLLDAELRRLRVVFGGTDEDRNSEDSNVIKPISAKIKIKADELLHQPVHAIITGAPGCGKTTLMRYLSWQMLKKWRKSLNSINSGMSSNQDDASSKSKASFPIFFELKQLTTTTFVKVQGQFEELLFNKAVNDLVKPQNEDECVALKQHVLQLMRDGQVAIFLDGLDEVSGTSYFSELQSMVSAFLQSIYGNNTVIISTRPFAVRKLGNAHLYEIAPFNPTQIKQFIQHYYGDTPENERFQEELLHRRELRELACVPALLGFILQLWRKGVFISDDKLALYDAVSREQVQQLDNDKEGIQPERKWLITDPDGLLKRDFLRRLAFDLLFKGVVNVAQNTVDIDSLVFSSDEMLKTARQFASRIRLLEDVSINPRHLVEDAKATSLLRQVGADKYAFTHLTLQEYLAAVELSDREDYEAIFCRAYFNQTLVSMEVLPMTLGLINNPNKLYQVINDLPESLNFVGMNLLARGLDYGAGISNDEVSILTQRLVDFIRLSNFDVEKSEYLRSFSWLRKQSSYCKEFASLLKHDDPAVRGRAAAVLGMVGDKNIVAFLLEALSDKEEYVRQKVAGALGRIGDKTAIPFLSKRLDEDKDNAAIYEKALCQLGQIDKAKIERKALGDLRHLIMKSDLIEPIKDALEKDLSTVGLTEYLRSVIKGYVQAGIEHADLELLKIAEQSFRAGEVHFIATIVNHAWNDRSQEVREKGIAILQEIGEPQALEILHAELELQDDMRRREVAATALLKICKKESIGALLGALEYLSDSGRWKMVIMMAQVKPEILSEGLLQALSYGNDFVRKKAISLIGYYATDGVKEKLSRIVASDTNEAIRNLAQDALQKFEKKLYYFNVSTPNDS